MILEGVGIAFDSIRVNKVRAGLTILGVAIGVMVVISMASVIAGINSEVMGMLERVGPKTFMMVREFESGMRTNDDRADRNPRITADEAITIQALPGIKEVAWQQESWGPVAIPGKDVTNCGVAGVTPNIFLAGAGTIVAGRNFSDAELASAAPVVILNGPLADQLFPMIDPLGRTVKIFGVPATVIGVYVESSGLFNDGARRPTAMVPHSTLLKIGSFDWNNLFVMIRPDDSVSVDQAQDRVITAMRTKRGLEPTQDNNFVLLTQDKLLETYRKITSGFFLAMLALSSVGLMVGGIGVVAVMMISVTERTREIGVRKALGATPRAIRFQFLVEAATLTLVGGTAGLLFGGAIAWALKAFTPIPATIPLWSIGVALVASTVTGIFFGLYPASRAAKLDPVEALRFE